MMTAWPDSLANFFFFFFFFLLIHTASLGIIFKKKDGKVSEKVVH